MQLFWLSVAFYIIGFTLTWASSPADTTSKYDFGRAFMWPLFAIRFGIPILFAIPIYVGQSIAAASKGLRL